MQKILLTTGGALLLYAIYRNNRRNKIINTAYKFIGTPYVWGGCSPSGFDCSGFVQYVFDLNGITIPRTTGEIFKQLPTTSNLNKGDLLAFDPNLNGIASHVGIYIGQNKFIHSSSSGVIISELNNFWSDRLLNAYDPF